MNNVFVYGSLKVGFHKNVLLKTSEFLGTHITEPKFTMYDLGAYPGVTIDGVTSILGEIFRVDDETMRSLDYLEGYPNFYDRVEIETLFGTTWMYVLKDGKDYEMNRVVETGEW